MHQTSSSHTEITRWVLALACFFFFVNPGLAQDSAEAFVESQIVKSKRDYRLGPGDAVGVSIFGEGDLAVQQSVDGKGFINLPLLDKVHVAGKTLREAEDLIETLYIDGEFLINPQATVRVVSYAVKVVYVFGEVRSPGMKPFPLQADSLDIVELISMAGDFTELAKSSAVRITRKDENGVENTLVYNVEKLIEGDKGRIGKDEDAFLVLPDDIIYVPERFL